MRLWVSGPILGISLFNFQSGAVAVLGDEQPAVLTKDPDGVALLRGVVELLATELLSPQRDLLELLVVVPGPLQLLREVFEVHAHGDEVHPGPSCNQGKVEEGGYLQDGRPTG